jgi:hypothetical protein
METKYKLIHVINGKRETHIQTLNYNDLNKAYRYFKNTFGNTTFNSLQVVN